MVTFMPAEARQGTRNATTAISIGLATVASTLTGALGLSGALDKSTQKALLFMTAIILIMAGMTIRINVNGERAENQQRRPR